MTVKTKRMIKKAAKNGVWAVSDIIFLALKVLGTCLLIAVTTGVVFLCVTLIYVRMNLTSGLEVDPSAFELNESSVIYYIDSVTGLEMELVTLQSTEFRRIISYEELPEHLINAVVAIEDHRFFNHHGVD